MIKQLLLASLLFFVASSFAVGKCFICEDKVPDIRKAKRITLNCNHSCHAICLAGWEDDVVANCPECNTTIPSTLIQRVKNLFRNAPTEDTVPDLDRRKPIALSSASSTRNRILFMLGGCGVAAAVAYYFRDAIGDLVWGKKETQSETDSQAAI